MAKKQIFNPLLDKRFQFLFVSDDTPVADSFQTTDDTTYLKSPFKSIAANTVMSFTALVTVVQTAGTAGTIGDCFVREYRGAIKNIGGTTSFVDGDVWFQDIAIDAGLAGISINFDANDTNDSLDFDATGEIDKTLNWSVQLSFNEITY